MAHLGNDAVMRAVASNRVMAFWGTLIGKKVVMAITGAILIGFVVADMIGNLKIFLGPDEIDAYSRFLREMGLPALGYGELLWIVRIVLLVCVALHVTAAIQLTRMSGAARPVGYNVKRDIESTFASRTMRWGGGASRRLYRSSSSGLDCRDSRIPTRAVRASRRLPKRDSGVRPDRQYGRDKLALSGIRS